MNVLEKQRLNLKSWVGDALVWALIGFTQQKSALLIFLFIHLINWCRLIEMAFLPVNLCSQFPMFVSAMLL